ncbi:MAG TPA: T9SS type A sorting domain-containing protein [Chitinophagaceae bacterium]|nr:T9SS type A sorting domain-containing protein [Chitinophagaceae bacterium]
MKKCLSFLSVISLFLLLGTKGISQITIASTTGYSVSVTITPKSIVPSSNSCQWGYNYNVKLEYKVTFSGSNIPASLYTLQGTLGCGSSSHFFDLPNNGGTGTVVSQSNVWNPASTCATATVSSLVCNTVNLEINGPGITSRTVTFAAASATSSFVAPLAVKLVDFNAEVSNDKVKLTWVTASEENNSYFSVERSEDGNTWTVAKTVKGAGNSSTLLTYQCFDAIRTSGTVYYRLKQTDFDGNNSYSNTRSILLASTSGKIYLFPVPNTGNTINFGGISDPGNMAITVRDAAGVALYNKVLTSTSVQIPSLKAGLYFVDVVNKSTGERTNLQLVKI